MDRDNANIICQARALRTVASLSNRLLLDIGVFLVLSSSCNRLISALAAISSAQGVKILIISLSKAFTGPIAALPTTMFYSIVLGYQVIPGNFFRGSSLCVFCRSFPYGPSNIFKFLLRKKGWFKLQIMLATQLIET